MELEEFKNQCSKQKYEIEYLNEQITNMKAHEKEQQKELYKAYFDYDMVKERLTEINGKYDFTKIDDVEITLVAYDEWSYNVTKLHTDVWRIINNTFECNLCNEQAEKLTTI